jgi:Tol biopolymer transport system component
MRPAALASMAVALVACAAGGGTPSATSLSLSASAESSSALPSAAATPPAGLAHGWLMFSRFDERHHTFESTHLIRPDGTGEVELKLPGPEGGGRWSHDGQHIAVMTRRDGGRIGTAIIQPDGTLERVLDLPGGTLNLVCTVWAPDDERLACEGFGEGPSQNGVYTVSASNGGDVLRLTTAPEGMNDIPGDYSPDGQQIIYKRTTEEAAGPLLLVDAGGGNNEPRELPGSFEDPGRLSPDGETILTSLSGRILFLDLDGEELSTIEETGQAYLFGPVWSPDGEWIAYSRAAGGPFADVFISRPDGSERWRVTNTPRNEIGLDWGPQQGG